MGKVIINGKEVTPAKKVKLFKILPKKDIKDLIKKKQDEQRDERSK